MRKVEALQVVYLSLLDISSCYEVIGSGTAVEAAAALAAHQNQDAQAVKLNSKDWAGLALSLNVDFHLGDSSKSGIQKVMTSLNGLLAIYNDRPDIVLTANSETDRKSKRARKGDEDGDDIGLLIGEKRAKTVERLLTQSTLSFWKSMETHFDEIIFTRSAWSERMWSSKYVWVGSVLDTDPNDITDNVVSGTEQSVIIDWTLPLGIIAHNALGERVPADYRRATATIKNPDKKTQMRKDDAGLLETRNVLALFFQPAVYDLNKACMSGETFKEMEERVGDRAGRRAGRQASDRVSDMCFKCEKDHTFKLQ